MSFIEQQRRSVAKSVTARVMFTLSHLVNGYIVTGAFVLAANIACLLYTSPSPRDRTRSRMPSSA